MDTLTDSVGVLFSTSSETEHGWILVARWEIDPVLGLFFLVLVLFDWDTNTVSGEDPSADVWFMLNVTVKLFFVFLSEGFADGFLVGSNGSLDCVVIFWGFPTKIDLVIVWFPTGMSETFILWSSDINLKAGIDGFLDGWKFLDVSDTLVWGFTNCHTTVESEDETFWNGAVRWSVKVAP